MLRQYSLSLIAAITLTLTAPALAQRDLKNIPPPDPEIERKSFIVADGFEVNLYAADPMLAKPIQMNFDAQGRLWIASSELYPQIKPGQKPTDKILVIEDTNGDGTADSTRVFADGLFIPTGVLPGDGGVYVANSTELIHLSDTNGDGQADRSRIVLSGFGTEDTHHLLHTLRWGHDGQMYMNQSIYIHSHVETPYGVKRLNGGGIWRFRPETLQLDVLAYGLVNTWGHHFDRWGQSFATDGAGGEGINYIFPGSVFFTAPGATRIVQGLNPGSPKFCGLEIASGGHLPDDWQGNMITNDFRAHRVCRFVVTDDGAGYSSRQENELIKSNHVAFRPIDVKMGPDGAIYIADWYNPIIQHGEVDFRDERRDRVHGRIWRVTAKGRPTLKTAIPEDASIEDLLGRLTASEEWVRLWAKLMLKQHDAAEVDAALKAWTASLERNDPNREQYKLETLWAHQSIQAPNLALLNELLRSPDARVRAAAVRVLSQWRDSVPDYFAHVQRAVTDEHPRVRLEGVRATVREPRPPGLDASIEGPASAHDLEAVAVAAMALDRPVDKFLDFALWKTFRDLAPAWVPALQRGEFDFAGNVDHLTYALKAVDSQEIAAPLLALVRENKVPMGRLDGVLGLVASLGGPAELGEVLDRVIADDKLPAPRRAAILDTLVESTRLRKSAPAGDLARVEGLFASTDSTLRSSAARAAGAWKVEKVRPMLARWAMQSDAEAPGVQLAAIDALASLGGVESAATLQKLVDEAKDFTVASRAAAALVSLDIQAAARSAVKLVQSLPKDADVSGLVGSIMTDKQGPQALAAALENEKLPADDAKVLLRLVRNSPNISGELLAAVQQAGSLAESGWKLTPELMSELIAEVQASGNAARGEEVYRRRDMQCAKCHAVAGAGGVVGPGLESIGASAQVDYIIESLLEPAAKVKEGYHSQVVADDNGKVYTGIPVRESDAELVLRDAEDRLIVIPKDSIEERVDGRSLMPEGLLNELTRGELVDLVRFLSAIGKVDGEYAVGKARLVRRWQALTWTPEAHTLLNRTSFDSAASDHAALSWEPAYSRVGGDLPTDDLAKFVPHTGVDPTSFVRFELEVSTPGAVKLAFGDPAGLALWVDGKPTTIAAENELDLSRGRHIVTLAINRAQRPAPVRVELLDVSNSTAQVQIIGGK
jgi:putative heme-binding domain-containing protein